MSEARNPVQAALLAVLAAGLAGCGPGSESEERYLELRETERQQREAFARTLESGITAEEVITLVKESAAGEEGGTTDEWLGRQMGAARGQVLFPRWEVRRKGASAYEARFSYSVLGDDHGIEKRGVVWDVDMVLKLVGAPTLLKNEDFMAQSRGDVSQQRRRQQKDQKFSLE